MAGKSWDTLYIKLVFQICQTVAFLSKWNNFKYFSKILDVMQR